MTGSGSGTRQFKRLVESEGNSSHAPSDRVAGPPFPPVGWKESFCNTVKSSWINSFILFLPIAMGVYFAGEDQVQKDAVVFGLCFLSIMALESFVDFGGEQLALYTGDLVGNFIVTTLKNAVEATAAIILLVRCELRLLKSTIVGVVLLHLLLAPGISFLTGGSRTPQLRLDARTNPLNHMLLVTAVMVLAIPLVIFTAMKDTQPPVNLSAVELLQMTHGIAIIMFVVYIGSRLYLHRLPSNPGAPSGVSLEANRAVVDTQSGTTVHTGDSSSATQCSGQSRHVHQTPKANKYVSVMLLVIAMPLMGFTVECLLDSMDFVGRDMSSGLQREWFGLILLPLLSFAADGVVSIVFFAESLSLCLFKKDSDRKPKPPKTLAEDRAIDMSIQFTLMWLPIFVLISWASGKPFTLLFDIFGVAILIAACFLVNYVTEDARTNWAGGLAMVSFYVIIALCAWSYHGQPAIAALGTCGHSAEAANI